MSFVDPSSLLAVLPHALITSLFAYFCWNFFFHPLSNVPGPISARLGIPIFRIVGAYSRTYVWRLEALHAKYGDVVRIGNNIVSTIDPPTVHSIYAHGSHFVKTPFYSSFQIIKTRPSLFSDIDPHSHAVRRRSVARVYTMKTLIDLERYVEPVVVSLVKAIDEAITRSPHRRLGEGSDVKVGSVEMSKWLQFFAADAVGELAFGRGFDFLKAGEDTASLLQRFANLSAFACIAGCLPLIAPLINNVLRYTTSLSPIVVRKLISERVDQRYKELPTFFDEEGEPLRRDMLTGIIQAKHPETNTPFPPDEVQAIAATVFTAGSETTGTALNAFFYFVLKDPSVYERVQTEIDSAFEDGRLQLPIQFAQGVNLPYLQACIKEAIRLLTPVGMEMPRVNYEDGILAGTYFLPKGTEVATSAYVFHRSEKSFGTDAKVFRPERWLDISDDERGLLERNFLSFGAGSRVCIGKNISMMEMTKMLPTLLWRYSFSIISRSPSGPHKHLSGRGLSGNISEIEPWVLASSFLFHAEDFWCDVKLRHGEDWDA